MQAEVLPVLWPYILKSLVGIAITGIGALMLYPVRYVKREWKSIKDAIASTHAELITQRENHLTHIEASGVEQVKLLTKTTELLDNIRIELAEQTGFLRASVPGVKTRARAKK